MPTVQDRTETREVLHAVYEERLRQEQLKAEGRFSHTCADAEMPDSEALAVLTEEVGEVARAILESGRGRARSYDVLGRELQKELIQVAAVAVAWAEKLQKFGPGPSDNR